MLALRCLCQPDKGWPQKRKVLHLSGKDVSNAVRPWTKSRGPIQATEQDVRKADAINALLVRPIALLPTRVGDPILPFTIGIFDTIRQFLKPETNSTPLRRAVGTFVHSKRYFFACAQPDSMRHDVDGQPVEPLSQEDRLSIGTAKVSCTQTGC